MKINVMRCKRFCQHRIDPENGCRNDGAETGFSAKCGDVFSKPDGFKKSGKYFCFFLLCIFFTPFVFSQEDISIEYSSISINENNTFREIIRLNQNDSVLAITQTENFICFKLKSIEYPERYSGDLIFYFFGTEGVMRIKDDFNSTSINSCNGKLLLFSIYREKIRILDVTENSGAIILNEMPFPGYSDLYLSNDFLIANGNSKCLIQKWDNFELTEYHVISGRISVLKVYGNMMYYYYEYYNTDRALRILNMETLEEQCVSESIATLYNYPILKLFKSDTVGYIDIRSQKTAWFDRDIDGLKGNMLASLGDYRIIDVLLITDKEFVFMTWEEICTYSLEDRVLKAVLNKNDAGYYETFTDIGGKMLLNYYEIRTTHGVSFLYSFKDRAIIYRIRRNWDTDENFTVYGRISMGFYEANDRLFMYPAYYEVDTDK